MTEILLMHSNKYSRFCCWFLKDFQLRNIADIIYQSKYFKQTIFNEIQNFKQIANIYYHIHEEAFKYHICTIGKGWTFVLITWLIIPFPRTGQVDIVRKSGDIDYFYHQTPFIQIKYMGGNPNWKWLKIDFIFSVLHHKNWLI